VKFCGPASRLYTVDMARRRVGLVYSQLVISSGRWSVSGHCGHLRRDVYSTASSHINARSATSLDTAWHRLSSTDAAYCHSPQQPAPRQLTGHGWWPWEWVRGGSSTCSLEGAVGGRPLTGCVAPLPPPPLKPPLEWVYGGEPKVTLWRRAVRTSAPTKYRPIWGQSYLIFVISLDSFFSYFTCLLYCMSLYCVMCYHLVVK